MQQSTRATTLDNIDQAFKAKYCDACPGRVPRPAGWTFYDEPY
jgi:hypothetical protein